MLFIEYPNCTTCQKARKWLAANGTAFQSRHIKEEPPTVEELKDWHGRSGLPLKKFFNTSGLKYKELALKDKLPGMDEEGQLALLASDGLLVKRPILVGDDFVLVGFREAEWAAALGVKTGGRGGMGPMKYRRLGKTGLMVSEIGFGAEWMERHTAGECKAVLDRAEALGINILDCWMSNPEVRDSLGQALSGRRDRWYIQGHIGSTWQDGQYVRTRDVEKCRTAFEDLLARLQTDYIDLGMIHFVDTERDWDAAMNGPYIEYVRELKARGKIRHIGMSTHNPIMAKKAAEHGAVEMLLFSVNPAFDMHPTTDDLDTYFDLENYRADLGGIDPQRAELYKLCEQNDVGITVMKPYAGGRLFDEKRSPFGVALTPAQCIHYCLTRPAVASVLAGYDTPEHVEQAVAYETACDAEKDYASVLAHTPKHTFGQGECTYCGHCKPCPVNIDIAMVNKYYDLASMQPEVPAAVRAHYDALEHHADECVGCKGCESRCPFGVRIAERMAKTVRLFQGEG